MTLDVLLVYLPYTGGFMPNLGLACVRSAMAQVGYSSQIINFDYSFSHVVNEVSDPHLRHKLYNLENWVGEDKLQGLLPDINDSVESWVQHIYSVPSNALGFSVNCFNHAATAEVIRRLRLLGDDRPILMAFRRASPQPPTASANGCSSPKSASARQTGTAAKACATII